MHTAKQTIHVTARMAMRAISTAQAPVSASNGSWKAAPNGVHAAMAVAAPQVSVLRLKAMPELTRMFGNWQMMTKVSTMKM